MLESVGWPRRTLPLPQPEGSASERLKDLEAPHAKGVISDTEYNAQRLQIISGM